jgi:GntR family transcriptional regulator
MAIITDTRLNQVKAYMLKYISQNQLKRNDQLPSEAAIAKKLGVSRNTLREAYVSLENEGVILRRHGIGTFVAHIPRIQDSLNEFSPFAQIIQDVGYKPNFQTLSMDIEAASTDVCDVFNIPATEKLRCISRLVLADKQPVIYVDDYIAPAIDSAVQSWDGFDGKLVQLLSDSIETPLHQIQSFIRAAALSARISKYLKLPEGSPVLSVRSTIFTNDNQPVTYSKLYFNSDIIELNIVRMIRTKTTNY